jgi:hypothetical protein
MAFDNCYYNYGYGSENYNGDDEGPEQRVLTETSEGKFDAVAGRLSAVAPKLREFHVAYYNDMGADYFE